MSDTGALGQVLDLTSTAAVVTGASSKASSLVAWSDQAGSPGPLQARVVKAGAFSGNAFELTPDSLGYAPAIAWDGTTYWAVWESSTHALDGRTVADDGTLGSVFSLVPAEVYAPALISDGNGQLLLSYAKLAGGGRSYRIASRLLGRGAGGSGGGGGGGSAAGGAGGRATPGPGGANGGSGAAGSAGSGGSSAAGSGGKSASGAGGSTGGATATGGTTSAGSGGTPVPGGSGGAAAGSSGTAGSSGGASPSCSVAPRGPGDGSSALGALFGLVLAFAARAGAPAHSPDFVEQLRRQRRYLRLSKNFQMLALAVHETVWVQFPVQ